MLNFLSIVTAERLNLAVNETVLKGLFKGIKVGDNEVHISHLQYADDTIFFREWSRINVGNLLAILKYFQMAFGLKLNLNKCRLFAGISECCGKYKELDRV